MSKWLYRAMVMSDEEVASFERMTFDQKLEHISEHITYLEDRNMENITAYEHRCEEAEGALQNDDREEELLAEKEEVEIERDQLIVEVGQLKKKLSEAQEKLDGYKEAVDILNTTIDQQKDAIEDLNIDIQNKDDVIKDHVSVIRKREEGLTNATHCVHDLRSEKEELQQEKNMILAMHLKLKKEHEEEIESWNYSLTKVMEEKALLQEALGIIQGDCVTGSTDNMQDFAFSVVENFKKRKIN